jgi:predicted ATPase
MASQRDPIRIHRRDPDSPWVEVALPTEHEPLPHPLSSLIGREAEIAAIRAQLQGGARLLTILGPGGVGKTRLALAVAADLAAAYPDGVVFVSLAGIPQASLVLPALAARMGVRETLGRGLRDVLVSTLQGRHLLVVLDNLEHVLGAAPDIAHLLAACPRLAILATSRSPLRISGEQRFQTPPLGLPRADMPSDPDQLSGFPAVRLFTERAREVQSDFALTTDTSPMVADICRRLDGLPLAIELAAPWVRVLPLPALAAGLEQRLTMLHGGPEDQPARLRTMREAIAWSYTLLDEDQAQVFRRLSIFVDGLTLSAASSVGEWQSGQRVASDVATVSHVAILDVLAALIDASLVQAMTDEGDEPRFRLLETVREYGLERLAAAGEAEDIAQAHAVTMAAFVAAAEPNLLGPDEVRWQARCAAELGNLRAALSWAIDHDLEMALRMGGSLWAYWAWYQLAEGRRWLTLALSRDGKVAPRVRSRALTTQAALAVLEGDDSELEITQEALELARAAGDLSAEAVALWIRACGVMSGERISDAIPDLDAALQLRSFITSPTDRGWIAYARALRGAVEMILGDPDLGHVDYEAAIQEIREVGSPGLLIMFVWTGDMGDRCAETEVTPPLPQRILDRWWRPGGGYTPQTRRPSPRWAGWQPVRPPVRG